MKEPTGMVYAHAISYLLPHYEICIGYGIIKQSQQQEELQNLTGGTLNDVELIQYKFVFPPITGKLQKNKIMTK